MSREKEQSLEECQPQRASPNTSPLSYSTPWMRGTEVHQHQGLEGIKHSGLKNKHSQRFRAGMEGRDESWHTGGSVWYCHGG